ncbi:MAG: cyclase family protein [Rhizobium sp.]|nr:cyclase family protein [Rhizobium sp.]
MSRRLIDLSVAIETGIASDPPPLRPVIRYWSHGETFHQIAPFFPGLKQEDLPDGEAWAVEDMQVNPHNGTHMDAPWHYHSTAGGQPAPTIDQTPLDYCFRPGVKLDFRGFEDGYVASADDVRAELDRIGYAIQPLDIVLVNTRAASRYGQEDYLMAGCGIGRDATLYLTSLGVKVVGTDAWSWDAPFGHTARKFAESGDPSIIWEGHKAGREAPYWQMEKLHNLESLPPFGFEVICFPVKIKGASAGWTRAVAMFDE